MNIKELRERMAQLAAEARSELDKIKPDTAPGVAKEIEARFDTIMADHDKYRAQLEREERLAKAQGSSDAGDPRRPNQGDGEERGNQDQNPIAAEYRTAFAKVICGQTENLTDEERQLLKKNTAEFRAQTGASTTAGGFLVPTTLANFIVRSMAAWGPMYDDDICTVLTTTSGNSMKLPTVNDTAKTASAHTEGTPPADTGAKDAVLGQASLDAYAYDTDFIRWSWELDMDGIFSMEQLLASLLGERLGRIANLKLTVGTNTGEPNGIVTASALGITAAGTTAITADEVINFIHSVDPAYRASPKARAMFNDNTLLALRKLKDGQGNYLITEAPDGSGRLRVGSVSVPYSINQAMASMATGNRVMAFGDFSKYFVRKVGSPVIGVLKERFWPDMGIAGLIRLDGELGDTAAIKHLKMA